MSKENIFDRPEWTRLRQLTEKERAFFSGILGGTMLKSLRKETLFKLDKDDRVDVAVTVTAAVMSWIDDYLTKFKGLSQEEAAKEIAAFIEDYCKKNYFEPPTRSGGE